MNKAERGKRLGDLRRAAGLLQRQVGAKFDIDKAAVASWEAGKSAPDRRKLVKLDELYDADGEVLRLFDVATQPVGRDVELAELRSLVAELTTKVDTMQAQLEVVTGAAVSRPSQQSEPRARRSVGGQQ